jgi:hypothetical protein
MLIINTIIVFVFSTSDFTNISFLSFHRSEEFKLESLDLGQLIKIRIRHDNLNGDGWFLEKVRLTPL